MNTPVWTLLLYMAADRGGGPVALPMASGDACRAAYTAIVEEQAERLKRVIEEKKGEGTGPGLSYGRCIDGATGRMVVLERRRRASAALD